MLLFLNRNSLCYITGLREGTSYSIDVIPIAKEGETSEMQSTCAYAKTEQVEVIDSFFQEAPVDAKPLWFLGKSLELLAGADIAYFAKGWQDARGCKIENTCAIEYGIPVIEDYTAE